MSTDDGGRDTPQPARLGDTRPSESWWSPPEPDAEADGDPEVDPDDAAADEAGEDPGSGAGGYTPPRSPAYDLNRPRGPHYVRSPEVRSPVPARPAPDPGDPADTTDADDGAPGDAPASTEQQSGPRWAPQLLLAGLVLALIAVGIALLFDLGAGGDGDPHEFGSVRTTAADATLRTGGDEVPLAEGHVLAAGDVVQVPADGSVVVDLVAGGVARADAGARLAFVDVAGPGSGGTVGGSGQPAIEVTEGRAWINPVDGIELVVRVPAGRVTTLGNPVGVECDEVCSIEAPAAGATIQGDAGGSAQPAAGEVITVDADGALELADGTETTDWSQQNLANDASEDVPQPEAGDTAGVRASAALDGSYPVQIEIVGEPDGDGLPEAVVYSPGETYDVTLVIEGSTCTTAPCRTPVRAGEGSSGTAEVADGEVSLSFTNPFDCYDENRATVLEPDIGTTTVEGALKVDRVVEEGGRWRVASFTGPGTVTTTLSTPCNTGDTLGTSASTARIAGGA
jgi:hypothetical protein